MKIFCFVLFVFLMASCSLLPINTYKGDLYERKFFVEKLKTDYFEEWGLIRTTGYGVNVKWNKKVVPNDSSVKFVCRDVSGIKGFFAGRLIHDEKKEKIIVECFSQPEKPINSYSFNDLLIKRMLNQHRLVWTLKDSVFKILYGGDSIQILSGEYYNHRLVCSEKDPQECMFDSDFEKKKDEIYFDGPFYEISLPTKGRIRSLMIQKIFNNSSAYKPLKLDPSILPLESPGYKKLREQENALIK